MTNAARPTWRDQILRAFTPQVSKLTLVADPDGLLLEEGVLAGIRERGFDLIPFDDHVAFRFAYESKYRAKWDRGESTDLVVVLRAPSADLAGLPYDLLKAGRCLSFSLAELFPNLSYPVIDQLRRGDLDALYRAQTLDPPGNLGDSATKSYALRHVFEISPEQIKRPVDLLRVLLRRHHSNQAVPPILDEHLLRVLRTDGRFAGWPLERIVPDREAFFAFLQERWPIFLAGQAPDEGGRTGEPATPYRLEFPGPVDLPFDHDDVRVYIDGLFLEGHLRPVDHPRVDAWSNTWAAVGLRLDPVADRVRKVERLLEAVAKTIPEADARHTEWLTFASRWAELLALRFAGSHLIEPRLLDRIATVRGQVDQVFTGWMTTRYGGLHNQPPLPPVMVHHLPRHLARRLVAGDAAKIALLVIDGLALDQWAAIRQEMVALRPEFRLRESAVFAWVPTLTTVSRQALFAAKPPFFFGASLQTTDREPALWTQFWADQGLSPAAVGYLRGLRDGPLTDVEDLVTHPARRAIGLVVDNVDRIMHGMELGAAGMHAQVRLWVRGGYLADLITLLLARGYEIHLTSDHGNVEATGTGRPTEGAFAEARGARARVYSSDALRRTVRQQFPDTIEWPPLGLPEDYRPLLAAGRNAFAHAGERIVAHGGIALEEVIVPHVRIESTRP